MVLTDGALSAQGKGTEPAQCILDGAGCCAGLKELKQVMEGLALTEAEQDFSRLFCAG